MKIEVAKPERISYINVNPRSEKVQEYRASCNMHRASARLLVFQVGFCQTFFDERRNGGSFWELKHQSIIHVTDFVDADFRDKRIDGLFERVGRVAWKEFLQEFDLLDTEYRPPAMSDTDFRTLGKVLMLTADSNDRASGGASI